MSQPISVNMVKFLIEIHIQEFHIMRDHMYHANPIMGGMWGIKLTPYVRSRMNQSFIDMSQDAKLFFSDKDQHGPDQNLVEKYIW